MFFVLVFFIDFSFIENTIVKIVNLVKYFIFNELGLKKIVKSLLNDCYKKIDINQIDKLFCHDNIIYIV